MTENINITRGSRDYLIIVIILLTLIAGLMVLGLYIRHTNNGPWLNAYERCAAANDSRVLETYPSQCITRDGYRIFNPAEQHQCGKATYAVDPTVCK